MRLTKLEHSAAILDENGQRLILDPGTVTASTFDASGVSVVLFTHEHPDHFSIEQLQRILEQSPDAVVLGTAAVAEAAKKHHVQAVQPGQTLDVDAFRLRFGGGEHAPIHPSVPSVDNLTVTVNERFYTAGDSFVVPEHPVDLLAVPAGAPWLKISEVIDFVLAVRPRATFPAHEMMLSEFGKTLQYSRIQSATEQVGGIFHPLAAGESLSF